MGQFEEMAGKILVSTCESDEILEDYDMDLIETGYLDSFSLLNVIIEIEDKMGLMLQPTDINKEDIRTVNRFIAFLASRCGQ